jgi:ABC-type multidrug transport system fused ATPase/permease subunit
MERAAELAEIAHDIPALPDGFDTVLGGGPDVLNGGQLQRICLARTLYRRPSLSLLDEVTSALDVASEAAIMRTFLRLRNEENMTIVSITHRLSTTQEADEIIVLKAGGVVAERGTYPDLARMQGGIFKGFLLDAAAASSSS